MKSSSGLIARVERANGGDRRLDADIVAAVLGPPGCIVDHVPSPDGHDIETAPNGEGENGYWREAEDVGRLTSSFSDALEFIEEARPEDGAMIVYSALRRAPSAAGQSQGAYAGCLARHLVVECLRAIAGATADVRSVA
jgi:hypothetical protein